MTELLTTLTMVFAAATMALLLSRALEQPAIPFYILSGIPVSVAVSQQQVLELSQLGISFLVFIYGVRFSTSKLRTVASEGLTASITSIVLTGSIAVILGLFIGLNGFETLVFASAAALSSSLVGLELIKDDLRKELVHGRLIESIQLIQDLFAVLLILVIFSSEPFSAVVKGGSLLLFALMFKEAFPYLAEGFKESTEVIMVFSLAILAVYISLTTVFGISPVIGAFAAGLSLSKYPYSLEIVDTVGSLKDFFTAILFVSIGTVAANINLQAFLLSTTIIAVTLLVKPFIIYATLQSLGRDSRVSFLSSLGLDQVSEFAIIIAIQAFLIGRVGEPLLQSVVISTAFTMALSTYTDRNDNTLYRKFRELFPIPEKTDSNVENPEDHVILVGFDTQGRKILEELEEEGKKTVVIEYDPEKLEILKERDADYVFGDVMHQASWSEAGYRNAELIVSTVPLRHVSDKIISLETDADTILRSPNIEQAERLLGEGATFVSVPKIMSSQRLVEHLKGVLNNHSYREELRRKNLLQLRKKQQER